MTVLKKLLIRQEKNHSLFEESIKGLSIPVVNVFGRENQLSPILFQSSEDILATACTSSVVKQFPHTFTKHQNKICYGAKPNKNPLKNKKVAVLFSGGPASGGHNIIVGLKDILGTKNNLMGVIAGPKGLIQGDLFEITEKAVKNIKNTGGFGFLGSDRTKIKKPDQFKAVKKTCQDNNLDAIVIIGGDDSNTNAAVLAEYLNDIGVQVIGVPKTIDGDLQISHFLPISFGFDTATKIYSEMVGNILQDTPSSRKYWHFVKLMGRSASHVALEVGLQTKPAICLISEEIASKQMSLRQIIDSIAEVVIARAKKDIHHGVVIIPEGIIEFIPEMNTLISDINDKLSKNIKEMKNMKAEQKRKFIADILSQNNCDLFLSLPTYIQEMLVLDRDSHGNLQVSFIPTERLLIDMVREKIEQLNSKIKFLTLNHFFGYEGRCGAPSLFDAFYTYNLGLCAGSMILSGMTGYMAVINELDKGGKALAIPLTGLMNIEKRHGLDEVVIKKALVEMDSPAFKYFSERRKDWSEEDLFSSPGPRQLWGSTSRQFPITVALNQGYASLVF